MLSYKTHLPLPSKNNKKEQDIHSNLKQICYVADKSSKEDLTKEDFINSLSPRKRSVKEISLRSILPKK